MNCDLAKLSHNRIIIESVGNMCKASFSESVGRFLNPNFTVQRDVDIMLQASANENCLLTFKTKSQTIAFLGSLSIASLTG